MTDMFAEDVVLVTGAAGGIGRALAGEFLQRKAVVIIADIDADALGRTAEELADRGLVHAFPTDVSDASQVARLQQFAEREVGAVDVLCNNAGVGIAGLSWETPADVWQWIMDVNVGGTMNCIRAFVPGMIERNCGHVMNVSSVAGLLSPVGMSAYSAAKHAIVGLTEVLFHEFQAKSADVGVSLVCPGMVDTSISDSHLHWPAERGPRPTSFDDRVAQVIRKKHKRALAGSMAPDEAARVIVDAMARRQFWVFTDDMYTAEIGERFERAVSGRPPAPSAYV
jgi:NAD(P)-dependent dehydrogenase (short-subunit alcohol dehydrogenase family)